LVFSLAVYFAVDIKPIVFGLIFCAERGAEIGFWGLEEIREGDEGFFKKIFSAFGNYIPIGVFPIFVIGVRAPVILNLMTIALKSDTQALGKEVGMGGGWSREVG